MRGFRKQKSQFCKQNILDKSSWALHSLGIFLNNSLGKEERETFLFLWDQKEYLNVATMQEYN